MLCSMSETKEVLTQNVATSYFAFFPRRRMDLRKGERKDLSVKGCVDPGRIRFSRK